MSALTVVEGFYVLEQGGACLKACAEGLPREQFALQSSEEALSHCVVVAIADRAHGAADAHHAAALAKRQRRILAAMIGVVDNPGRRTPIPDRHLQRPHNQLSSQMISHRPAHHASTEHVE